MNHRRWKILSPAPSEYLSKIAGYPPLLVQLLFNRGVSEPAQAAAFLAADKTLQSSPYLLADMDKAVARIYRALLCGESIAIYGDFDADGVCGTALLVEGISLLGGKVTPYIPRRLEGYGLNYAALESLFQQGVTLVISVDCGITSIAEVDESRKLGLDIIITDHHAVLPTLPSSLAVINPRRADSSFPFAELAGAGVAFKLLQALLQSVGRENYLEQLMDLVALGTVIDMMPLRGENRYLVKRGLQAINQTSRVGLRELALKAGLRLGAIDVESISWILGPRLNASGRLDHAITSYKLLTTNSREEARSLAEDLEQKNAERQRLTAESLAKAREQLLTRESDLPLLIVRGTDYPIGIIGLIAGKLAEEFYLPAIVLQLGQEEVRGSARSIPEFNLVAALRDCQNLLSQFGGHPSAAGFTAPRENLDILEERLLSKAREQLGHLDLHPHLPIDAEIRLSALNKESIQAIAKMAPFGQGNPQPTLLSRQVKMREYRPAGGKGEHLKLKLTEGNASWEGIGFGLGNLISEVSSCSALDIVYTLGVDRGRGGDLLQLNILDFAPSRSGA